jgi:hypothetical protein
MFGTYIHDQFKPSDFEDVRDAVEDNCSAKDNWGWASVGLYFFRELPSNKILYIGLANDLSRRFSEHTGLKKCDPSCCKINEINDYFNRNDVLGITLLVQSAFDQPILKMSKDSDSSKRAFFTEGYFIKLHELIYGEIPSWNGIQGSVNGQKQASATKDFKQLLNFVTRRDSFFTAKKSIRELADNPYLAQNEVDAHTVRMMSLNFPGMTIPMALSHYKKFHPDKFEELDKLGYFIY